MARDNFPRSLSLPRLAGFCLTFLAGCAASLWWLDPQFHTTSQVEAQTSSSRGGTVRPGNSKTRPGLGVAQAESQNPGPIKHTAHSPPPQTLAPVPEHLFNEDGLTVEEVVNIAVYDRCNRSVVNISSVSVRPEGFFALPVPSEGSGSGSVLDRVGHVLTNYHVIEGAKHVTVTLYNEEQYAATLVGADPINDMAVIKIDAPAENLFPILMGDSDNLKTGMRVYALGNPFGLDRTLSTGIISSLNRSLEIHENCVIKSIIQIDAAINPGNSGGPLLDSHSRLIGVNTAIATAVGSRVNQSAGIGFAIPVNVVRRVVPELIQHGRVIRGDIGITHATETEQGLRIVRIVPGGPAEKAGLRGPVKVKQRRGPFVVEQIDRSAADVIIAINGQKVTKASEFLGVIETKKPGDVVELTILREGKDTKVSIRLSGDEEPHAAKGRADAT